MSYDVRAAVAKARKPFDIVKHQNGAIGFITEVNINSSQSELEHQLSYSIYWLCGSDLHYAWWKHTNAHLTFHENLFEAISMCMAHPFGSGRESLKKILKR